MGRKPPLRAKDHVAPRLFAEWPMKRYVEGEDRSQSALFPERLDDYIAAIMQKMQMKTMADLVRAALKAGIANADAANGPSRH